MSILNILNTTPALHLMARAKICAFRTISSPKFVYGTLLLLPAVSMIFIMVLGARFLPVRGDNAWAEAHGIVLSDRWARGIPLYNDFRNPPYIWTSFPPLWYGLMALADRFGISDPDGLTLVGRVFTVASLIGAGSLAYFWNRRRGFTRLTSLSSVLFFGSFPILIPWAVSARPDFPVLFLSFLSVYVSASGIGLPMAGLSGFVAALAFLMKHSAIAAPLTIGICMLWCRRWRSVFVFSSVWVLVVGVTMFTFEVVSGGLLSFNLRGSHVGPFSLGNIKQILVRLLASPGQGFTVALLTFGVFGILREVEDRHTRFLRCYFMIAGVLAIMASGLENAGENHFLEVAFIAGMFVPRTLVEVLALRQRNHVLLVLLLTFALLLPSLDFQRWRMLHEKPSDYRRLVPLVQNDKVFTDIPYLAARSLSLELLEPIALTHKEKVHAWSSSIIVDALNARSYKLVILDREINDPRWESGRNLFLGPGLRAAIASNYTLCFEMDAAYVYAPILDSGGAVDGKFSCAVRKAVSLSTVP